MHSYESFKSYSKLGIIAALILLLPACSWIRLTSKSDQSFYPIVEAGEIETEIVNLEKSLETITDYSKRGTIIFRLATLYSHPQNQAPDYTSALKRYEEYLLLFPDGPEASTVKYIMALLTEIERNKRSWNDLKEINKQINSQSEEQAKKENREQARSYQASSLAKSLEKKIKDLANDNADLKKQNKELSDQIVKMREIIEKLKYLDIRLEKKRRDIE